MSLILLLLLIWFFYYFSLGVIINSWSSILPPSLFLFKSSNIISIISLSLSLYLFLFLSLPLTVYVVNICNVLAIIFHCVNINGTIAITFLAAGWTHVMIPTTKLWSTQLLVNKLHFLYKYTPPQYNLMNSKIIFIQNSCEFIPFLHDMIALSKKNT